MKLIKMHGRHRQKDYTINKREDKGEKDYTITSTSYFLTFILKSTFTHY